MIARRQAPAAVRRSGPFLLPSDSIPLAVPQGRVPTEKANH
jgi:hypothetical protein